MTFDSAAGAGATSHDPYLVGPLSQGTPYSGGNVSRAKASSNGVDEFAVMALVIGFIPFVGTLALAAGGYALYRMKSTGRRGRMAAVIGMTFGGLWAVALLGGLATGRLGH